MKISELIKIKKRKNWINQQKINPKGYKNYAKSFLSHTKLNVTYETYETFSN